MAKSLNSIGALAIAGLLSFFHFQGKQREPSPKTEPSFTRVELAERTLHRRAVESVVWGTPAVNFDLMYQAMVRNAKAGQGSNKIVYWSRLFSQQRAGLQGFVPQHWSHDQLDGRPAGLPFRVGDTRPNAEPCFSTGK
jgi:hypothetical protein